jgi:DHA2 family multidrug resistance protein
VSPGTPSPPAFGTLRRNWHLLAAVLPGVVLTMLDAASLDLPRNDITQALNSDKYRIQRIFSAYLIGSASGMCLTGFLSGRLGLRWSYLLGLAAFASMAGLCALVSEVVWMTPLRFVQGFGTGLTVSAAMVLLLRSFPDRRALAMAVYGMGVYLAALAGPTLGGLLTYEHSWRCSPSWSPMSAGERHSTASRACFSAWRPWRS